MQLQMPRSEAVSGSDSCCPPQSAGRVWGVPGFGPMTGIETDLGPFPAQTLRRRDRIRVRGGGFREIVWLDRICLDETFLSLMPDAQPIQISASAFGPGIPAQSLLVSPSQGVLVPGGTGLCTARELLAAGRAQRRPETMMTWTMFACSEPVDVCAAGLWLRVDAR